MKIIIFILSIFLLFGFSINSSDSNTQNTNSNLRQEQNNNSNNRLMFIKTNASKTELLKIFSEQNFDIVNSLEGVKEENTKENTKEINHKNNPTKEEKKENTEIKNRGPIITQDDEDFLDQIYNDDKEKEMRQNKTKKTEFDAEEGYYYNLIDYNKQFLGTDHVASINHQESTDISDDSFAYAYSLITFFAVLILAAIGLRFILSCEKNEEVHENQTAQQELFLNYK